MSYLVLLLHISRQQFLISPDLHPDATYMEPIAFTYIYHQAQTIQGAKLLNTVSVNQYYGRHSRTWRFVNSAADDIARQTTEWWFAEQWK